MNERQDISQELSAYLDAELAAQGARRIDAAVRSDSALAEQFRGLRAARGLLRGLGIVHAPAGFVARVLAEALRRGLLRDPADGARPFGPWATRLAAAAALLLAACVGAIVSATVWTAGSASPLAARRNEPPVALARADEKADAHPLDGSAVVQLAHADKRSSEPDDTAVRPGRYRGAVSPAANALDRKLAGSLQTLGLQRSGVHVERIELCVTDLSAARRQLEATLAAAKVERLAVSRSSRAPAAGPKLEGQARERAGSFYRAGPAGAGTFQCLVWWDSSRSLAEVTRALRGIAAASKDHGSPRRLCLAERDLSESRPAGLPPAATAPRPPTTPIAKAKDGPYEVARLRRLASPKPTAAGRPAPAAATQAAGKPCLLVITVHLAPEPARPAAAPLKQKTAK